MQLLAYGRGCGVVMRYYTFARLTKLSRNVLVHEGIFAHSLKSWMRRQILFQLRDELEEEDILADGREKKQPSRGYRQIYRILCEVFSSISTN